MEQQSILSIRDLSVEFRVHKQRLPAVKHLSLDIYKGECLAVIGESGSGKTMLTRAVAGLLPENGEITGGTVLKCGAEVPREKLSSLCGSTLAFVFQEPSMALNSVLPVGEQIARVVRRSANCTKSEAKTQALALMQSVGIENAEKRYGDYPHTYSGGMQQRIVIAAALACRPEILICDEATTALDVTVQMQILDLLKKLRKELGFTLLMITHDFGVVARTADRVAVMYAGEIAELGTAEEIFHDPRHPYTWALLRAMPQLADPAQTLYYLPGTPPSPLEKQTGDPFAPRSAYCRKIDTLSPPPLFQLSETHFVRSWLCHPEAPPQEKPAEICDLSAKLKAQICRCGGEARGCGENDTLLAVKNASVCYGKGKRKLQAVRDASFTIHTAEVFALVGESGSGKTSLARAVAHLLPLAGGEIVLDGRTISKHLGRRDLRALYRKMQLTFQNQMLSLNDRATVEEILTEGIKDGGRETIRDTLRSVGLTEELLPRYPHELSGGQRQRLILARSLILSPQLVIADEPVSSLDVSVRAQVLQLIRDFRDEKGTSFLFIAHDLSVVRLIADRIAVMQRGRIVELAPTEELFFHPLHPYTQRLMASVLLPDPLLEKHRAPMGEIPLSECADETMHEITAGHFVRCTEEMTAYYTHLCASAESSNPLLSELTKPR